MASRTQIVCLCEGRRGGSVDEVFINKLMRTLKPAWIRFDGNNVVRAQPCGGRADVVQRMPGELKRCLSRGGDTTLMVWADCDHDCSDPDALKAHFWKEAQAQGITKDEFDRVVFIFAKDRIENWIEFLLTGTTDEAIEGPRPKYDREASDAARNLASMCRENKPVSNMPPSLQWSCRNWRALVDRMKTT